MLYVGRFQGVAYLPVDRACAGGDSTFPAYGSQINKQMQESMEGWPAESDSVYDALIANVCRLPGLLARRKTV